MSFYYDFDPTEAADRRTAAGLLRLREKLDAELPPRTISDTVMLATWNIREFDSSKYGHRTDESIAYIAEIAARFDLIAIQEVHADLSGFKRLLDTLGIWWKFLLTDVTAGSAGNSERMAFLYDSRKVKFGGLSGEVVIPDKRSRGKILHPQRQLARTPFLCGFEAGWLRFMLCTVHIYYGTAKANDPDRVREIEYLSKFMAGRVKKDTSWSQNLVLLGDFNIFRPKDVTFGALKKAGFFIPEQLQSLPSNIDQSKHYDQMAFVSNYYGKKIMTEHLQNCRAGVFNFFEAVYREDEEKSYGRLIGKNYRQDKKGKARTARSKTNYYKQWRTFQLSDHLPMWMEIPADFGHLYLTEIANAKAKKK